MRARRKTSIKSGWSRSSSKNSGWKVPLAVFVEQRGFVGDGIIGLE